MTPTLAVFEGMTLPPRWQEPLYRSLARHIRDCTRTGRLQPGDLLPREEEIAKALHISVGTVAHAINLLVRDRVLAAPRGERIRVLGYASPGQASALDRHLMEQRLKTFVRSIDQVGGTAEVHLTIAPDQELVVLAFPELVDRLDLSPGSAATVNIRSADVGLLED